MSAVSPFLVKNCAISIIATGDRASSLSELRDKLLICPAECVYYHFWGSRLSPQFNHPEYHNDFASWAHRHLHDEVLAETLGIIDPTEYTSIEQLRIALIEVIDARLEEDPNIPSSRKQDQFHFIRSQLLIFSTAASFSKPEDLIQIISLPLSSIFYHFIDARTRTPEKKDDFSTWLKQCGPTYLPLIEKIESIDPYFLTLGQIKTELIKNITDFFKQ